MAHGLRGGQAVGAFYFYSTDSGNCQWRADDARSASSWAESRLSADQNRSEQGELMKAAGWFVTIVNYVTHCSPSLSDHFLTKNLMASGIVVTAPTSVRVHPIAFR